jgi:hypothetical protein
MAGIIQSLLDAEIGRAKYSGVRGKPGKKEQNYDVRIWA